MSSMAPPPSEPARQTALRLLVRISAVLRVARLYQVGNQVLTRQLEELLSALRPACETHGEVLLIALEEDLFLNGQRVPLQASHFGFHQAVVEEFRARGIAGLYLGAGLGAQELETFCSLFFDPRALTGRALLAACRERGLSQVLPVVHAATSSLEAELRGNDAGQRPSVEDGGPGAVDEAETGAANRNLGATARPSQSVEVCSMMREGARSLLATTSLHGGVELRHAKRLVQPIVDLADQGETVLHGLAGLGRHDQTAYAHAANVVLVALTMAHRLGLDRRALVDLGVAALFHDAGMEAVSSEIHHPLEALSESEWAALRRHPAEGARLLGRATALTPTTLNAMRVAFEHHATRNDGYPTLGPEWKPSVLSRVVAVADCYVSLLMHRSERGRRMTPQEALGSVVGPLRDGFEPVLLWALVASLGFYPPGQLVELDDGSVGLVLAPSATDPARPHLRLIADGHGTRIPESEAVELHPLPPERSVRRALSREEYPEDLAQAAA